MAFKSFAKETDHIINIKVNQGSRMKFPTIIPMKAFSSRRADTFQELSVLPLPQNFIHSADLAFIAIQLFLHFIQGDKT